MKAPTADYSPLSQALSAKTNAKQASYSAKDSANWKSRYKIQTDSFDLQKNALDNQQGQLTINGILGVAKWADGVLDDVEAFVDTQKDKEEQEITSKATNASNDINLHLQNNPQFSQSKNENGIITVGLSAEGEKYVSDYIESVFPEGTKYGWGADKTVQKLKQELLSSAQIYAGQIATQRTQDEADAYYSNNMQNALLSDLQSGNTITTKIPDVSAEGGYREVKVGAGQEAIISSREPYMGKTWADNQRQIASDNQISKRGDYLISDASTNFSNGTYITDPTKRASYDSLVKAQAEEYTDETKKQTFLNSVKSVETRAVQTYFDNQVQTILAQPLDSYTSLSDFYTDFTDPKGQFYSIFFDENGKPNPNIEPSTYTTIATSMSTQLSNIETLNGQTNTQAVQNLFNDINNQYAMGQINSTTWGARAQAGMEGIYGSDWRTNSEALNVYKNQLLSQLPDDISSDPQIANGISSAYNLALGTKNKAYKDLDTDQKNKADIITKDYMDKVISLILNNPELLKDSLNFNQKLNELSSQYTKEWADAVFGTSAEKVTAWEALTGKEVYDKATKTIGTLSTEFKSDIANSITEDGYLDRSSMDSMMGVNSTLTDTITSLGNYGKNVMNMNISDARTGILRFKVDSDGTPIYDNNGNLIPTEVVWQTNSPDGKIGFVSYDLDSSSKQKGRWNYRLGENQESKPSDKNSIVTQKSEEQISTEKNIVKANGENPSIVSNTETKTPNEITNEAVKEQKGKAKGLINSKSEKITSQYANKTVKDYVKYNANSGDRETLKAFLFENSGSEEELNALVSELEKSHKAKEFVPGLDLTKDYQAFINSVVFSVKEQKGWK